MDDALRRVAAGLDRADEGTDGGAIVTAPLTVGAAALLEIEADFSRLDRAILGVVRQMCK